MTITRKKTAVAFIVFYFLIYLTATFFQSVFWGDILSPFGTFLAAFLIYRSSRNPRYSSLFQRSWLFFSGACLFWTAADLVWAYMELVLHQSPEKQIFPHLIYYGANLLLLAGISMQLVWGFRKWNAIQLAIDSIAVTFSIAFFFWIVILDRSFSPFQNLHGLGMVATVTVLTNIAAFTGIATWLYSVRNSKILLGRLLLAGFLSLFYLVDLYWFYLFLNDKYQPNSMVDAIYIAAFLGVALSAHFFEIEKRQRLLHEREKYSNIGTGRKSRLLLLIPLLAATINGFRVAEFLWFLLVYLVYETMTTYVQRSVQERAQNKILEQHILERTKELVEKNQQLDFLSNHDIVTELFNRRYFCEELHSMLENIQTGEALALLYIDIDRFKTINDTYGHHAGDQVLMEISRRIDSKKPERAMLARFGGDEFVLAAYTNYGYQDMELLARDIIEECNHVIYVGNYSFQLTVSIGIAIYPLDAGSEDTLLQNADMAMYQAKYLGYNRILSFNQELNERIMRKNSIELLLKQADFEKEFTLYYQPQFSVPEKTLLGMEALLRWKPKGGNFISPAEFIPIAEEMDYIIPIGDWVIKKAIRQIDKWNKQYQSNLKMGINVSPKQLDQIGFIRGIQTFLRKYDVDPAWVDIELTEGVAMERGSHITEITRHLRNAGVSISIDDFGTGYSSLTNLKLFPFERIKIAKPLIDSITSDDYDLQITKFTIQLAKSIGIRTIAEGVETAEQFQVLADLGCEEVQGYYLGHPIPAEEFERLFLDPQNRKVK